MSDYKKGSNRENLCLNQHEAQSSIGLNLVEKRLVQDQILHAIEKSLQIINPFKSQQGKDIVIFQGNSGVGKSSTILTLAGEQMISYHHPQDKQPIIITSDPKGRENVRIQTEIIAGTIYPACIETKKNVALWDMPGIGQNRGRNQTVMNMYFYTKIFEVQNKIKISLLINHTDLNFSYKGNHLQPVLRDFVRMYGDVEPFRKSLILIITKCPGLYKQEDALRSFRYIKDTLPFVKESPKILKLVGYLCDQTIPILIFNRPKIGEEQQVRKDKSIVVTGQYHNSIEQFYRIIKTLPASSQVRLQSPLSEQQIRKNQDLVTKIIEKFRNIVKELVQIVQSYVKSYDLKVSDDNYKVKEASEGQIRSQIDHLRVIKQFVERMARSIERKPDKVQIGREIINEIQQILVFFGLKEVSSPVMLGVRNSLNMFHFLNMLKFNQYFQESYTDFNLRESLKLTELEATKIVLKAIQSIQIHYNLERLLVHFTNILKIFVVDTFQKHLIDWQQSQMYQIWKRNFVAFPAASLKLTKFVDQAKKNNTLEYMKEIQAADKTMRINADGIKRVISILQYNTQFLHLQIPSNIITANILPMLQKKHNQLISKVVAYQKWEKQQISLIWKNQIHFQQKFVHSFLKNASEKKQIPKEIVRNYFNEAFQREKILKNNQKALQIEKLTMEKNLLSNMENYKQQLQSTRRQSALQVSEVKRKLFSAQVQLQLYKKSCCIRFCCCKECWC